MMDGQKLQFAKEKTKYWYCINDPQPSVARCGRMFVLYAKFARNYHTGVTYISSTSNIFLLRQYRMIYSEENTSEIGIKLRFSFLQTATTHTNSFGEQ